MRFYVVSVLITFVYVFLLASSVYQYIIIFANFAMDITQSKHTILQSCIYCCTTTILLYRHESIFAFFAFQSFIFLEIIDTIADVFCLLCQQILVVGFTLCAYPIVLSIEQSIETFFTFITTSSFRTQIQSSVEIVELINLFSNVLVVSALRWLNSLTQTIFVQVSSFATKLALTSSFIFGIAVFIVGYLHASVILHFVVDISKSKSLFAFSTVIESCWVLAVLNQLTFSSHVRNSDIISINCRHEFVSWFTSCTKDLNFVTIHISSRSSMRSI